MDAQEYQHQLNDFDSNLPMSNYEKSKLKTAQLREQYGEDPDLWPEGVRPADQSKEQQLIGGDDDEEDGGDGYQGVSHYGAYNFQGMIQNFTQSLGFGGANRTDDVLRVQDNNGIYMPARPMNRSSS